MRPDKLYLADIVDAGRAIKQFLSHTATFEEFVENDLVNNAVLYKLVIIGEAVSKLSNELKARHPEISWRDIIGFRNYTIHGYFSIDWAIAWNSAKEETPILKENIERILKTEFPNGI